MEKSKAAVEMLLKDQRVDLTIRMPSGDDLEDVIDPNSDLKTLVQVVKEAVNNRVGAKQNDFSKIMQRQILREMSNDLGDLLESGAFSDFKIVCGGESFACHKNILGSRSTYMEAMLNSGMKEVDDGVLEIKDLDVGEVKAVLKFIYTGRVEKIKEKSSILLRAADRYELSGLKKLCERELMSSMKSSNVLDRLVLADSAQANNLRDAAKKWILKHHAEVIKQKEWREKMAMCGVVIYEIFEALSSERPAKRRRAKTAHRHRQHWQHHQHNHYAHEHEHDHEHEHQHEHDHEHEHQQHEHEHGHQHEQDPEDDHEQGQEQEQDQDQDNNPEEENEPESDDEPEDEEVEHLWHHPQAAGHHNHHHGHHHHH